MDDTDAFDMHTHHKVIIAIQARLSSARLPGKILRDFGGQPLLVYQMRRLIQNTSLPVVALIPESDAPAIQERISTKLYSIYAARCEENDVLGRYAEFARAMEMDAQDTLVRVTGDCPLLCPSLLRRVIKAYEEHETPLAYYGMGRGWPDGLGDIDVMRVWALWDADEHATDPVDREHVSPWLWKHPGRYPQSTHPFPNRYIGAPWPKFSVDTEEDFSYVQRVLDSIGREYGYSSGWSAVYTWETVLQLVERHSELRAHTTTINAGYLAQLAVSAASWEEVRYGVR